MKTPRQNFDVSITLKFKRKLKYVEWIGQSNILKSIWTVVQARNRGSFEITMEEQEVSTLLKEFQLIANTIIIPHSNINDKLETNDAFFQR